MDNTLFTLINNTHVANLYRRAHALQVTDGDCLLGRWCLWELSSLLISRSRDTKVHTIITTIAVIIARVVRRGIYRDAVIVTFYTLTTIAIITVSLTLVSGSADDGTNGSTSSHTHYGTDVTTTPATGDTSYC